MVQTVTLKLTITIAITYISDITFTNHRQDVTEDKNFQKTM